MTTEMLEKFEELNPDIDVVMDYPTGTATGIGRQVAGGQTPDVFQMDFSLAEYVENGVTAVGAILPTAA
ncbi:MAG: hypothetical protein ACLRRT_01500 [Ruthenibacterium lactatiformans]